MIDPAKPAARGRWGKDTVCLCLIILGRRAIMSTHWCGDKMAAIIQTTFQMQYSLWKWVNFDSDVPEDCSHGSNLQYYSIRSDNRWWPSLVKHICVTRPQWVDILRYHKLLDSRLTQGPPLLYVRQICNTSTPPSGINVCISRCMPCVWIM